MMCRNICCLMSCADDLFSDVAGWFAGPVIFGMVIDTSCSVWSASCSGQGACALYDNDNFRMKTISLQVAAKVLAAFLQVIVFINARKKTDWEVDSHGNPDDNVEVNISMLDNHNAENGTYPDKSKSAPIYKGNTH